MKKGLLYFSIFLVMAALACKSKVESPEPVGIWKKDSAQTQNQALGTLEFKANSHFYFTSTSEDHSDTHGRYSLAEDHITFEDDTCYNPGTYQYELENNQLTFQLISDSCEIRTIVLSGIWIKEN